jgi:hypothetical protein
MQLKTGRAELAMSCAHAHLKLALFAYVARAHLLLLRTHRRVARRKLARRSGIHVHATKGQAWRHLCARWRMLHTEKQLCAPLPWVTPDEALRMPLLDCKGLAVLCAQEARECGFRADVRVGYSVGLRTAHAYVYVYSRRVANCFSAGLGQPVSENFLKSSYRLDGVYVANAH